MPVRFCYGDNHLTRGIGSSASDISIRATDTAKQKHRSMMTSSNGNIFRVTGHLYGKFTGHRLIPRTKASDAEL